MIGLLAMAVAASSMAPSERAYVAAAKRCGFEADQIVLPSAANQYSRPAITANGDLDRVPFAKVECLMRWAAKHHKKMGFISEPPPSVAR